MKILITGGAGFIGSAVVRSALLNHGHMIVNVDSLTYAGNLDSLASCIGNKNYIFEHIDICDRKAVQRVFQKYSPDVVMHLAAESHVDRSIDNPGVFLQTNIIGTYNLLECAKDYFLTLDIDRRSLFKFHHVSTDEVYGDLECVDQLFTEDTPYAPSSPYSASKASSDHLVRAWGRTYGLPVIITNCSNNYGPFHFPEKLSPHVILNALQGAPLPVYGDGMQIRDWLYVEDHVQALLKVVTSGGGGETYNIGGHNEKTNIEVVRLICDLLEELAPEKPVGLDYYSDLIVFVADRPGHDQRYAIDARKIERDLEWKPKETFETGLRKTVEWYLHNERWWKRVLSGDYQLQRIGGEV